MEWPGIFKAWRPFRLSLFPFKQYPLQCLYPDYRWILLISTLFLYILCWGRQWSQYPLLRQLSYWQDYQCEALRSAKPTRWAIDFLKEPFHVYFIAYCPNFSRQSSSRCHSGTKWTVFASYPCENQHLLTYFAVIARSICSKQILHGK